MHPKNLHHAPYDFQALKNSHEALAEFVILNKYNTESIDFSNPNAVLELNKALLKHHYKVASWTLPKGYLCPPIPGRADYIHHIYDLVAATKSKTQLKGLDIGTGANCIYPILGAQLYGWKMVGSDIDAVALASAVENTELLKDKIEIRSQESNADIFKGIIKDGEYFDFTLCNPPFHASEKEAIAGTRRKLKNLKSNAAFKQNFGGQANELWCNGGEALFIKRMIKQSIPFKNQVGWFTCLVSKSENLAKIYKQLDKAKASYQTVEMEQGNKKSRFIAWKFSA
ncbi:23S rRNA (adenine(1618)-N(6))-methyltransferase RlmF [Cellulophaga sp. E16_2]|uniref:Ribosomal RNA large subunit methyltransferase F n=1 Tax=Cellulophaga algicola (strain DSM 14237 / IC166 / ACAM 630) TaxID=688270 RepID=E6XEL9_CELAD|nr:MULTISPECIES: 23S rRNA (adenine(1618)-N(6))-methyltransferase RlmF [Cellulophaga]ADV51347.1 23S rRNA m(6)A-1618 methyltransferase [Cellulophaga algicola DSM 14237]MBO0593722.1 23S rRNA (adenine(1618)-N(6))-methyltransferase RlmF [Cellulophaga sp. E16_2]